MAAAVTLSSLCHALRLYIKAETSSVGLAEWRAFEWLWQGLSFGGKTLGMIGCFRFQSLRERILLPHLISTAIPYIERYRAGSWRKQDEERLLEVVQFVIRSLKNEKTRSRVITRVSEDLVIELEKESFFRSFSSEKEQALEAIVKSGVHENAKIRAKVSWGRHETFSQYSSRLKNFVLNEVKSDGGGEPQTRASYQLSARNGLHESEKTKSGQADPEFEIFHQNYIQKLRSIEHQFEELMKKASKMRDFIQEELLSRAILLRVESENLPSQVEMLHEKSLDFLIDIESLLEKVVERISKRYTTVSELKQVLDDLPHFEKSIQQTNERNRQLLAASHEIKATMDLLWKTIDGKLHELFKMLDSQPLLPVGSLLRSQQLKMIKMAREKLKQYRMLLQTPPGAHVAFHRIESETHSLYKVAKAFYDEGIEIEEMRRRLKGVARDVQAILSESESDTSKRSLGAELHAMLEKIALMEKNLEIIADRQGQFQKVTEDLARYSPASMTFST